MAKPSKDEEEIAVPAPVFSVTAKDDKDKIALPDAHDPVTGHGRWLYEGRLGEGGLATVFRAWDCKGGLGFVAVKVLKKHSKAHARHAFAMHRESQWSLERLHNRADPRYSEEHAKLFARYLEDHTGFVELGPEDFEERRKDFESPSFDWYKQRIDLPIASKPYVVMELVKGETLQVAMPSMSATEKRQVILQCATALEYLERFHMIHRDFRGCNMHLIAREKPNESCQLKILDLGVMISSEAGMEVNCNMAVQAFRRRGETEEKRKRYDWLPWEVRSACDELQGAVKNFEPPGHSFDAFSLGVLILHLLLGKTKARSVLDSLQDHPERTPDGCGIGVPKELLGNLLAEAAKRPRPREVCAQLVPLRLKSPQKEAAVSAEKAEATPAVPSCHTVSHTTTKMEGSSDEEGEMEVVEMDTKKGTETIGAAGTTETCILGLQSLSRERVTGQKKDNDTAAKEAAAKEAAAKIAAAKEAAAKVAAAKKAAAKEAAAREAAAKEAAAKEAAAKEAAAKEAAAKEAAAKEAAAKEAAAKEAAAKEATAKEAAAKEAAAKEAAAKEAAAKEAAAKEAAKEAATIPKHDVGRRSKSRSRSRNRKESSLERKQRPSRERARHLLPEDPARSQAPEEKAAKRPLAEETAPDADAAGAPAKEARRDVRDVTHVSVLDLLRRQQAVEKEQEEVAEARRKEQRLQAQKQEERRAEEERQKQAQQALQMQAQYQQMQMQMQWAQHAELLQRHLLGAFPGAFPGFPGACGFGTPMTALQAAPSVPAGPVPGVVSKASAPPPKPADAASPAGPAQGGLDRAKKGTLNGQSWDPRELMAAAAAQLVEAQQTTDLRNIGSRTNT
ncbi:unnamed protein product [Durusdinium trenchii]|uniref:Protein kinase domain-containing protein n=1 Tax=Durusdinium trenchii TaxID=1381693 RepID=A0ABP0N832_9DINO